MNVQDAIDRAKAIAAQLAAQDAVPSYKRPASDAVPPPEPKRRFTNFVDEIHIPGQYVGLVSGKNGETLKLIERGYNVEINLKSSDREGKLSIAGDPQDVGQVKDVVQEIMRTGSIPLNLLQSGDQSDSVSILIPGNKVGLIIGKGGETITSLQSKSGAKIILDSQERTSNDKTVTIQGSPAAIAKAKELIKEVIGTGPGIQGTTEVVKVPNDKVGLVIGKGGETIKSLNQQYGIRITIEQPSGSERAITLAGPPNALEIVKNIILDKVGLLNHDQYDDEDIPKEPEYTLQDYIVFYNWYQAQIGGEPMDEDVLHHVESDDEAPPGMAVDAPPGLGIHAPPGMEVPPGMEAPPGLF